MVAVASMGSGLRSLGSWAVSGLRCSAVGWRLCGLGHLWFAGLSLREFVEDRTISDPLLSCV